MAHAPTDKQIAAGDCGASERTATNADYRTADRAGNQKLGREDMLAELHRRVA
jgi:hypothetical protein